jgi:hypothetical protein
MLTEGTYRTEASASFELSRMYTAPVVKLWWMIVVSNDFLNFRNLGFGAFCRSTPPYETKNIDCNKVFREIAAINALGFWQRF